MKYNQLDWKTFIELGQKLVGKKYVLGAEVNLNDADPDHITAIDCSELVEWLFKRIGLYIADGSYNQIKYIRPVCKDNVLIGDLGFKHNPDNGVIHHVGVYLGEGRVLEAKGIAWGVVLTPREEFEASPHFLKWGRHQRIESDPAVA